MEAEQQKEHKDMRDFWIQERVQDGGLSIKEEKNCANVGKKPIVASVLQCCSNCKIGILQDHGSHTPLQDEGEEPMMGLASSLQTRYEHTQKQKQNQKQKQKQTVVSVDREHRDECTN